MRCSASVRRPVTPGDALAGRTGGRLSAALRIGYKTLVQKAKEYGIADS